ncbi:hypothetical protein, partial [Pseudomonas aeruginosa]|uniref:hypothetical protein n=1 Tax=Pseudomonas aeruginosa TaxID=287 RepID=UPI00374A985F
AQNPTQSSSPASSTTIIKETVNNNNKNSTNIWLIVLSSLSALVTIIGGVIAVIRHFRNRLTKSKPSFVNTSVVHSTSVVGKTDAVKTQEPVGYQSQRHLTETQQMKRAADQILKENKHKTSFRRSR